MVVALNLFPLEDKNNYVRPLGVYVEDTSIFNVYFSYNKLQRRK